MHLGFTLAWAAETTLTLNGQVPTGGSEHFFVPFEVPPGTVEIAVHHDDGSPDDILDWGLRDPSGGFRGWGGGNTEDAVVSERAASRSYVAGPIPPGTWSVVVGKAKIVSPTVSYTLVVTLRDVATLSVDRDRGPFVDPGVVRAGPGWFAGDTHVHSRESGDADATLDEIAALALSKGLDFVVITDHDTTTGAEFLTAAQARWPDLLFVPGTEYTTYQGHATAFGATEWVEHALDDSFTIDDAVAAYADDGVFFSLNHPDLDLGDLCIGCAWDLPVPDGVGGIEIATGSLDVSTLFTPAVIDRWEALADEGQRLTPLGGSDDHRAGRDTGPLGASIGEPVTMVWAESLSVASLTDSLRAGRAAVKLGDIDGPLPDLVVADGVVSLRVTGGDGAEVQWFVDGSPADRVDVVGDDATFEQSGSPGQRTRAEIWAGGSLRAVSGFVVFPEVDRPATPPDEAAGCGCHTGGSPAALIVAILLVSRRRRR